MASKCVKRFEQRARMWQTTDRQRDRQTILQRNVTTITQRSRLLQLTCYKNYLLINLHTLPSRGGQKADMTRVAGYIPKWFVHMLQTVNHPNGNRAQHRETSMEKINVLTTTTSNLIKKNTHKNRQTDRQRYNSSRDENKT